MQLIIQRNFAKKKRAPKLQNFEGIAFFSEIAISRKQGQASCEWKAIPKFGYIVAILLLWMIASVTTSQN
jgi:hypothetical protein